MRPSSFQVEKVLDRKVFSGKVLYKVKWVDFPEQQATWQAIKVLSNAKDLIKEYKNSLKNNYKALKRQQFNANDNLEEKLKQLYPKKQFIGNKSNEEDEDALMDYQNSKFKKKDRKRKQKLEQEEQEIKTRGKKKKIHQLKMTVMQKSNIQNPIQQSNQLELDKISQLNNNTEQLTQDINPLNIISDNSTGLANPNQYIQMLQKRKNKKTIQYISIDDENQLLQSQKKTALKINIEQKINIYLNKLKLQSNINNIVVENTVDLSKINEDSMKELSEICKISFLQVNNQQQNVYLVEDKYHKLQKLSTGQIMDRYPEAFISFLQSKIEDN